jgi:hypothetical protein
MIVIVGQQSLLVIVVRLAIIVGLQICLSFLYL